MSQAVPRSDCVHQIENNKDCEDTNGITRDAFHQKECTGSPSHNCKILTK